MEVKTSGIGDRVDIPSVQSPVTATDNQSPSKELQVKIDKLEGEFLAAWTTLEFLSKEYLTMWERLETVELLLYQQQATIARLVGTYGENGPAETSANPSPSKTAGPIQDLRNGPLDSDDDDDFAAKVEAQLRSLESSSYGPGRQQQDSRLSADEAFYRSLNSAHRDSPSLVSDSDNELRMIWESSNRGRPEESMAGPSSSSIFSAQDYLHYRDNQQKAQQQQQDVVRPPKPKPPDDEEDTEGDEDDWMWRKLSGSDSARQLREIERVSRKLKRDSQRLQELRERLVQSTSVPLPSVSSRLGPPTHGSVDQASNDLHEQLRLAFLESARQKSARLQERQHHQEQLGAAAKTQSNSLSSLGYSAGSSPLLQQPSIYSAGAASASVACLPAPVHIDPLHLGRSNSSENVSPSFSSYLRTPAEVGQTGQLTGSNPTSPLVMRKKNAQRSPTPQPKSMTPTMAPDPSIQLHLVAKSRTTSDGEILPSATNLLVASTSRSPNKGARLTGRRGQGGPSPTRIRTSSIRSDSGVSSLSGNWSSMDPERSPVSPSKLLLAGHHSSSSLQQLDFSNLTSGSAPPPPAPIDGQIARPSSRMMFEQQAVSPSPRSRSHSGHGQPAQPHLTTETWNVQGSICSVATASEILLPSPSVVPQETTRSRIRPSHSSQRVLARHDSTWVETEIDDPFLPSMLDGDWYSPRGIVHPQNASQHHYRSNTPSPAPGSLPEGHFVPEPANVTNALQSQQTLERFHYPTLTFEPCQDADNNPEPANFIQSKSAGCSPKQRRRLQGSSQSFPTNQVVSSSRLYQQQSDQQQQQQQHPGGVLEHQLSSPGRLIRTTPGPAELSSSSPSIDYYDLYYQTPSHGPSYLERNHASGSSYNIDQEVYLFRNPLPNYEDQGGSYEHHRGTGQENDASLYGRSSSPSATYTSSSQVIVSQCGYISIASSERLPVASHQQQQLSPGKQQQRTSPRKKIRSTVSQLMPYFNRPKLKNRSVSLPGVDSMDQMDRGHLPHSASGSSAGMADGGSTNDKRFSFGRASSLPGIKKGKKIIKQLSNIIGGRRGSHDGHKSRPASLQSLPQQADDDWINSSRPRPLRTLDIVDGGSGARPSFVAYCNEGFDSGNDWDDELAPQMAVSTQRVRGNSLAPCIPVTVASPASDSSLMTRRSSATSSGEFAASRALGRYRRMAAAEAAATTTTSSTSASSWTAVESLHPLLPDVTVVSSSSSGSQPEAHRRNGDRRDRPPSGGSDDDASLSLSLNLDLMARHLMEEQQRQQQDDAGSSQEIFFPKVAIKSSPKRSPTRSERQDTLSSADESTSHFLMIQPSLQSSPQTLSPTVDNNNPNRHYLEPDQSRTSLDSAPASPRPLANINRSAPRWQSTEESIDTDDEWYRYGMMQLEEMERRAESGCTDLLAEAARQYNQQTSYDNQMQAVFAELQARVPVIPSECESGAPKIRPSDVANGFWPSESAQGNWCFSSSVGGYDTAVSAVPEAFVEEENDDWAAYASSPNRAGQAAQESAASTTEVTAKVQDEDDEEEEEEDDYSSGETSGPDSPQNQSFDDDGENELYYQYDHESNGNKEPEYCDAVPVSEETAMPSATGATASPAVAPFSTARHSISGSRGSDIFPSSGNILSAAGSTASNIASSVFSFFTSTPPAPKENSEEQIEPAQQPVAAENYASLNNIISAGTPAGNITPGVSSGPAEPESAAAPSYQECEDMDAMDTEQQKMLKLTLKGSAARWKLVKTLRDKKAETANVTATSPTTSNEAVRQHRCDSF